MILRAKTSTCFFEEREGKGHSSTHNTRAFFPHCFCFYVGTLFWLIWSFFQVHELVLQCLVTADLIQCTFYFRYCAFHDLKFHLVYSCSPPYTYTHTHTVYVDGRKIIKQTDFQQKSRTTEMEDRHLEERKSMRKSMEAGGTKCAWRRLASLM